MDRGSRPTLVGVAGGSGSGKSTLVRRLAKALGRERVAVISFDAYYRDRLEPGPDGTVNFDHPDALEADLFLEHLEALREGRAVAVPTYDFTTHRRRAEVEVVAPAEIVLAEGILLLAFPEICARLDGRVFVQVAEGLRFARRLGRDVRKRGRTRESVVAQFEATVRPMHDRFVEPSKALADRVVSGEARFGRILPELAEWIEGLHGG